MHCMPCCQLTYQKYIDKDGKFLHDEHDKLMRVFNESQETQTAKTP